MRTTEFTETSLRGTIEYGAKEIVRLRLRVESYIKDIKELESDIATIQSELASHNKALEILGKN